MTITVFGASGKVGRLVVADLLRRGHSVVAFVHNAPLKNCPGLLVIKGDIRNKADVERALQDSQAVVSTLGSWGTKDKNIVSTAMSFIVPAMQTRHIKRIVTLTGNLASAPGERLGVAARAEKALFNVVAPKILRDSEDHIQTLSSSGLDYTVLRSPVMITFGTRAYSLSTTSRLSDLSIHRAAVARAMADLAEGNGWLQQCPYICRH